MKIAKITLIFLAVLLVIIILNAIWIGILVFTYLVKYLVLAAAIAIMVYVFNRKGKKDSE